MYFLYFIKDGQIYYYKGRTRSGNVIYLSKLLTKRVKRFEKKDDAFEESLELYPRFDFKVGRE